MMRAALVPALCLATAAAWSRLEIALQNYPRVHDRNLRAFDVPRPVDGTRTDGDGWALSGRRGGRHLYKLASYPNSSVETLLLLSGTC